MRISDGGSDTTASAANGHIVGIDPGHQGENVDMSATEAQPGPGSSTMAKASTGTSGSSAAFGISAESECLFF